jgi:hypothetical protein
MRAAPAIRPPSSLPHRTLLVLLALLGVEEVLLFGEAFLRRHHVGGDFGAFYAVSLLLHSGRTDLIGSPAALRRIAEELVGWTFGGEYHWPYPPMARLVVYPLALVPTGWAYAAAMGVGIAAYLSAVFRIVGARWEVALAALVFPGLQLTLVYGQVTFLTAALLGWGLALLPAAPLRAGVLLGLLSFKPHLAILLPVALVAGRRWRAALAASATAAGFALLATVTFGWQAWTDFFRAARAFEPVLATEAVKHLTYQSVFTAVRLAGGGVAVAWAAQAVVAGGAAACVWRAWSGDATDEVKAAVVAVGSMLVTPHLGDYDLTLLAIPIAFFVRDALARGWRGREPLLLLAAGIAPMVARNSSRSLHLALGPWVAIALLWAVMRRAPLAIPRGSSEATGATSPAG